MNDTQYRWFIKPLNDTVNEQVAALLASEGLSPAETERRELYVNDTLIHDTYEVPRHIINTIERSKIHRGSIRVYVQEGVGKVKVWPFYNRSRLSRTKAVREAAKQLKKPRK